MARQMKNSGIEWIGDIPSHWQVMPHKYVMHKEKSICENYNGEDIISLTMNGVIVRDLDAGGKMPTTFDGYQYVEPEDLLLCLFDIDVTPRCVGIVRNYGVTSPAYSRFKVHNGYHNAYYDYLLRFIDDEKVFIHLSKNLRSSLTETDFGAIKTVVPPLDEQKQIADFLDTQCSEIEAVIAKTRATIEEYKKLKQSIITEAVTKGIRSDRPMKDSGIEWIGEIVETYSVIKLKHLLSSPLMYGANETGISFDEKLPRYIRITDITMDGKLKDTGKLSLTEDAAESYILQNNDVLFARSGASVGKAFIYKENYGRCAFAGYLIKASIGKKLLADYLFFYTQSSLYEEWKNQIFVQATIQNIGADRYNILPIVLGSIDEQKEIVNYLEHKCTEIDTLIEKKTALLEEMETYKKSVIYEYVTGKKEVK